MEFEYYVREAKADIARQEAQIKALEEKLYLQDRLLDWHHSRLWDQLSHDIRFAVNRKWSIAAESTVRDIVWIARSRGVTAPDSISIPLLVSGVYHAVCSVIKVEPDPKFDYNNIRYREHWGDYETLMGAIPFIKAMEVEEFVEGLE